MSKYLNKTTGKEFKIGDNVTFEKLEGPENSRHGVVYMFLPILKKDIDELVKMGFVEIVEDNQVKTFKETFEQYINDYFDKLPKYYEEKETSCDLKESIEELVNTLRKKLDEKHPIKRESKTEKEQSKKCPTINDAFRYYEGIYGAKWYDTYAVLHDCCPTALLRMYVQYFASLTWYRGVKKPQKGDVLYYIRNVEGKLIVSDFVVPKDNYVFAFPAFTDKESAIEAAKLICEDLDFKDLVYGIHIG